MRAFRLAYDGRPYHGFQRQPDVPTVEDALLGALRALDLLDADTPAGYAAAGRTDAGVSAVAQTVAFEAPGWLSPAALNGDLPPSVRAWATADAPAGFHATRDAVRREYTYHLHAPDLRADRARDALDRLAGAHDFHNLTPDGANTERTLETGLERDGVPASGASEGPSREPGGCDGEFLVLTFAAGGFPRQMVRRAVSLVRAVAAGEREPAFVERVLSAEPLPGPDGLPPAPAYPLVLTRVEYPDLSFVADDDAAASARAAFAERRVERLAAARVAGTVIDGIG